MRHENRQDFFQANFLTFPLNEVKLLIYLACDIKTPPYVELLKFNVANSAEIQRFIKFIADTSVPSFLNETNKNEILPNSEIYIYQNLNCGQTNSALMQKLLTSSIKHKKTVNKLMNSLNLLNMLLSPYWIGNSL